MRFFYPTVCLVTMCLGCGWAFTSAKPAPQWVRLSVRVPGYAASEVERDVAWQVEAALATLPDVLRVQSVSYPNELVVWSKFDAAKSSADATSQIANALDAAIDWPDEALEPLLRAFSSGPILLFALHHEAAASELDSMVTAEEIQLHLAAGLQRIPHVADVSILGKTRLQFEISVDQDRLRATEIKDHQLAGMLQMQFLQRPPVRADAESIIRIVNEIPLRQTPDGNPTQLGAVADVRLRLVAPAEKPLPSGEVWPAGWILFGVHCDSLEKANACADAVANVLASFPLPAGAEIVRDLDRHPEQLLTLASVAWSRAAPPEMQFRQANSPAWHSHFIITPADVRCRVAGPDFDELQRLATEVRDLFRQDPLVSSRLVGGTMQPELRIEVDRDQAAAAGLSAETVLRVARALTLGPRQVASVEVQSASEGMRPQWADVVLLTDGDRRSLDTEYLSQLQVRSPNGGTVPLGQLCRMSLAAEPAEIHRAGQGRHVEVHISTRGQSATLHKELLARLSGYEQQLAKTHPEYHLEIESER